MSEALRQAVLSALKDTLHAHREVVSAAVTEIEKKYNAKVLGDLRILGVKK